MIDGNESLYIEIINDEESEIERYESMFWGSSFINLTDELIDAIKDGKLIAFSDGEYSTFIGYKKE